MTLDADLFATKLHLQRKIISPQRVIFMSKNIFVHGAPKLLAYAKEKKEFQRRDWSFFPHSTLLQHQYYLTKQQTFLELERSRLDQIRLSLQNKQTKLEKLCQEHEAVQKIEMIVTGILRKNLKFIRQLEEVENRDIQLKERINHVHAQLDALKIRLDRDTPYTQYKIISLNQPETNEKKGISHRRRHFIRPASRPTRRPFLWR